MYTFLIFMSSQTAKAYNIGKGAICMYCLHATPFLEDFQVLGYSHPFSCRQLFWEK